MATTVKLKDSRSWEAANGGNSAEREYVIIRDSVGDESFSYSGLPTIGSAHPTLADLEAKSISFSEGSGRDKYLVIAKVKYEQVTTETDSQSEVTCQVTQWGWDAGTVEKELITDQDGVSVMNSAGDMYADLPKYSSYAPTFTKVMRFKQRQTGALGYNCKVNQDQVTIGGQQFPVGSMLISVTEKRILPADGEWKYEYQVQMKYRSNLVKIEQGDNATEIGWDAAVTDAGMREKDTDGTLKLIRVMDKETGQMCKVTSPELLDGSGHAIVRSASGGLPDPYNFRYKVYARVSVPAWFYSEPS